MSDIKCPFCGQELKKHLGGDMPEVWCCDNEKCKLQMIGGDIELWQELIRTRKALEIAVDALKLFDSGQYTPQPDSYGLKTDASRLARKTLEQITAIEQKNHFANASKKIEQKDVK